MVTSSVPSDTAPEDDLQGPNKNKVGTSVMSEPLPLVADEDKPGICGRLLLRVAALSYREGEARGDRRRKNVAVPAFFLLLLIVCFTWTMKFALNDNIFRISDGARMLWFVLLGLNLTNALVRKDLTLSALQTSFVLANVGVILYDWDAGATSTHNICYEFWPLSIIIVNSTVLMECSDRTVNAIIYMTMGWLLLKSLEDSHRFGMYDLSPSDNLDTCNCSCAESGHLAFIRVMSQRTAVFLSTSMVARGFVERMRADDKSMQQSVRLAEEVASALVLFDLELAESFLDRTRILSNLSVNLTHAFRMLIDNLRIYRPYLGGCIPAAETAKAWDSRGASPLKGGSPARGTVLFSARPNHNASHNTFHKRSGEHSFRQCKEGGDISEIASDAISVIHDEERLMLQAALDVGISVKKASVLQVEVHDFEGLGVMELFSSITEAVATVIDGVKLHDGVVMHISADEVLSSWNTHRPCLQHAMHACACASKLSDSLLNYAHVTSGLALSSGTVKAGHLGTTWQRSPFMSGTPVFQVRYLAQLARELQTGVILTEYMYDLVKHQLAARLVDVVSFHQTFEPRSSPVGVYELMGTQEAIGAQCVQLNQAFTLFRTSRYKEACACLENCIKERTFDPQIIRLIRLSIWAQDRSATVPQPYVRPYLGWEIFETRAQDVPLPPAVQLLNGDPSASVSTPVSTIVGVFGDKAENEGKRFRLNVAAELDQMNELCSPVHGDQDRYEFSTHSSSHETCLPTEFTDNRGARWVLSGRRLGKGAYGEVWLGMGADGALMAFKTLPLAYTPNPFGPSIFPKSPIGKADNFSTLEKLQAERIEDFLSEVDLLSSLKHENIVCYLGCAVASGHAVLCMEYVPGGSLQSVLTEFGKLQLSSVKRYTKDMVKGLNFLHQNGILHRDLKPANVLLQIDGQCKLADFGASGKFSDATGRLVGTPVYMAPEVCRGDAFTASDVWALGITVCQMITGVLPYPDIDFENFEASAFMWRLGMNRLRPDTTNQYLTEESIAFVERCFETEPDDRADPADLLLASFLA